MKLFKWGLGRQPNVKYKKLCFLNFRIGKFGFDGYILKYQAPTILNWHTDPVENGKHHRLNLNLKGSSAFIMNIPFKIKVTEGIGGLNTFRPDLREHKLVVFTDTIKLSLGFVKYE